jgi:hypothetical protein
MGQFEGMSIMDIKKLPGVNDLSVKAGGFFAMALKFEEEGNDVEAAIRLDKAVAAEAA